MHICTAVAVRVTATSCVSKLSCAVYFLCCCSCCVCSSEELVPACLNAPWAKCTAHAVLCLLTCSATHTQPTITAYDGVHTQENASSNAEALLPVTQEWPLQRQLGTVVDAELRTALHATCTAPQH
eukprot:16248-Heterococcus_DN1.PRE.7